MINGVYRATCLCRVRLRFPGEVLWRQVDAGEGLMIQTTHLTDDRVVGVLWGDKAVDVKLSRVAFDAKFKRMSPADWRKVRMGIPLNQEAKS